MLTLAEIIRRGVSIEWPEGVALVRSVVERLAAQPSRQSVIPELNHIELGPSGVVEVTGGQSAAEPVRRIGQLLQATLGHGEPPVQLRLVISQATAPTPQFGSIREFDEILGYYERPNREGVLQSLYERAAAAPAVLASQPTPALTVDSIAPLPSREVIRPRKQVRSREDTRRLRRLAAVAVVLIVIIAAGVQYIRVTGSAERDAQIAAIAQKASSVVGDAVVSGLSAVTENVGLGRLVTEEPPGVPAAAPTVVTPDTAVPAKRRGTILLPGDATPIEVFDLDAKPNAVAGPSDIVEPGPPPSNPPTPAVASTDGEPDMFTTANGDVIPPVGIRPQLPRELPRDVRREDLARIDLVVAADGTVETVKLISTPRDVSDSMWLSAVKAWQFQPALKDGRPVRYLKTVWLAPR